MTAPPNGAEVMRHFSLPKLAFAVCAGAAIAMLVVSRPLTAPLPNTIQIEDMTWVEVRSAIDRGYTTVIVPSGGLEQNGPHMIIGKHDRIVRAAANRIATELGATLVAPVIPYVPEGSYDPPSGHMRFPGTIGVPEQAYAATIEGIARSLKAGGFRTICFIADHGGGQAPQAHVVAKLNGEWAGAGVKLIDVADYYSDAAQVAWLLGQGNTRAEIGEHASIIDTSELMAVSPDGVDLSKLRSGTFSLRPTGIVGEAAKASAEMGTKLLDMRINAAVRQIRAQMVTQ
jgi:creatinine amidohydrolase/Fe(II)-dependent formamide hydrolase-like protein